MNLINKDGKVVYRSKSNDVTTVLANAGQKGVDFGNVVLDNVTLNHVSKLKGFYLGKTVKPKRAFEENRWDTCASGIHFFPTEAEAKAYNG